MKDRDGEYYLKRIEAIRRKNNHLHVGIYRIAWNRAPKQFKQLIKEIDENDKKISRMVRRLVGVS